MRSRLPDLLGPTVRGVLRHVPEYHGSYGEAVQGRGLEHRPNAVRVGSRLAWRHLAVGAERLGRPRALIRLLAGEPAIPLEMMLLLHTWIGAA